MTGTLDVNLSYNNFICEFQDLFNIIIAMQVIHGHVMD